MSSIVPYVNIYEGFYHEAFALYQANKLWTPELYADGEIFGELALMPLDALPPATSVTNNSSSQNITPPSDATTAVEDAAAATANDYGPTYIFSEYAYRIEHGFNRGIKLQVPMPQTGLTLLRDHKTRSTATKLIVLVEVQTYTKWSYGWNVTFSARNPFREFNRGGEFESDNGRRAEVCVHAFCAAIDSIVDFINDNRYPKPQISNFYVRVPQFADSRYALRRLLPEVEQGGTCLDGLPSWVQQMHVALSHTVVQLRKLRAQGVNVRVWQSSKRQSKSVPYPRQ
ncbi:uncharacterized protein FMAN_16140 [Fusarium mangiferae]|uniref:Uncharacterized protein n=1 Tax=Fusarium mangiferae TaxID=192010 RepID=A0A1L7TJN2_FUSMA|nr:uncharacterized protein FMAN_16140 [Fusarium mangiferae]CVK95855.1 uncharacterized protein FMAN_16140 [Fusarium mangiferae]